MKKLLITTLGTVALTGCFSDTNKHLMDSYLAVGDDPKHESIIKRGENFIIRAVTLWPHNTISFLVDTSTIPMEYIGRGDSWCEIEYYTSSDVITGGGNLNVLDNGVSEVNIIKYQEILNTGRTIKSMKFDCFAYREKDANLFFSFEL